MRQVDLAQEQSNLARQNNWVGLITALVAGSAAWFAAHASKAARDTVNAFTEVERANIVITLENFREDGGIYDPQTGTTIQKNMVLVFDVMANNLGRSTAIIVHAGSSWHEVPSLSDKVSLPGQPKTYIVKPADSAKLQLHSFRGESKMDQFPYFWVLVSYNSPLRGLRFVRYCFEVWDLNSSVPYAERIREEWGAEDKDEQGKRRSTPMEKVRTFIGRIE